MKNILTIAACSPFLFPFANGTSGDVSAWQAMQALGGHTWVIQGEWSNGKPFLQEIRFDWSMDSTILLAHSYDAYTGPAPGLTLRSEGVRAFDRERNTVRLWEFDHLGGITEGEVILVNGALHHNYDYRTQEGMMRLTDAWIPNDTGGYTYRVGVFSNGMWTTTYLTGIIHRR